MVIHIWGTNMNSLVKVDEQPDQPNSQAWNVAEYFFDLVMNTTAYHLGQSSPSTTNERQIMLPTMIPGKRLQNFSITAWTIN